MALSAKQAELFGELAQMTDEQIVEQAQSGSDEAVEFLILKYKNFVRAKARSYFLVGADREDIIQEGMIGLYKLSATLSPTDLHPSGVLLNFVLPVR